MGRRVIKPALMIMISAALFGCTSPLREAISELVKEYSTPTAIAYFSGEKSESGLLTNNSGIAENSKIIVIFSESMNTGSLVIGGNTAEESDGGLWSETSAVNDTLTLTPASSWTGGSGRTLTVACSDLEDYAAQINVEFGVITGVIYVHAEDGSNTFPGTSDKPKATITEAVKIADYLYAAAEVHVAEGTYRLTEELQMTEGISLYGGYSADDWQLREADPAWAVSGDGTSAHPTILTGANVSFVIHCPNLVSQITIDGFDIDGGTGDSTTGLYCENSSPVLSGLKISGGLGDSSTAVTLTDSSNAIVNKCSITGGTNGWSGGMLINASSPHVQDSIIGGGTSGTDGYTFGIYCIDSTPVISGCKITGGNAWGQATGISNTAGSDSVIFNNTINGGTSSSGSATGISCSASSPVIRNNTICGGNSTSPDGTDGAEGLFQYNNSNPVIENNIIFTILGNIRIGVNAETGSAPASLKNNDIFETPDALYSVIAGSATNYTSIGAMETALGSSASGNIKIDLVDGFDTFFTDEADNWHLTAAADVNVRQGGLDGAAAAWPFTVDKDGTARTNSTGDSPTNIGAGGWSMGAFEKD
ncbi:MAG: right-handed parallel beta-helix repeat-containing protein [Spirochaetales bacterium]|nr:right-handed parallel beta-helix repeat-containing protein [Spirochaetales bacterium]